MGEANPYESPEISSRPVPVRRYEEPRDLWLGILGMGGGAALVGITAYYFVTEAVLWVWGLGGGIGILGIGALRLKSYFDDKRYSMRVSDSKGDRACEPSDRARPQGRLP